MTQDILYIYDKKTFKRSTLGEVQNDFNMSFVIDGTKDSLSVVVHGSQESEIEPYSIIEHAKTNTWWVVSHDKVERYQNDDDDFIYVHNLELLSAIELLNARDLTDCGFNDKTYTIRQFMNRLCKLSSFEFNPTYDPHPLLDKEVNFIKTFENYTLLSALREFLDGYNCSIKLNFLTYDSDDDTYLSTNALFTIISKTGDYNLTSHTMSYFDDTRETKTMSKESFGACVVSNAENVISSVAKTFPSVGGVKLSSAEYLIKPENAFLKLPSNVFKGNWLKMQRNIGQIYLFIRISDDDTILSPNDIKLNPFDETTYDAAFQRILNKVYEKTEAGYSEFETQLNNSKDEIIRQLKLISSITLYNGNELNAFTGEIVQGTNVPYLPIVNFKAKGTSGNNKALIFCDKETKETLPNKWQGISWERGSNKISGFEGFGSNSAWNSDTIEVSNFKYTDFGVDTTGYKFLECHPQVSGYPTIELRTWGSGSSSGTTFPYKNISYVVNYIPMGDLKVKVDNRSDKKDTQLYNQNGKITDNYALSKLLNSYSQEISGDNITKFKTFYSFASVPKIGSIVYNDDNEPYVINNISLTFSQNEDSSYATEFGYQIDCEFTMSKFSAVKSLLTNPNTNIRDYGIPQNFNVKRKQLYRDFYELNYRLNNDSEEVYYLNPMNVFNFGHQPNEEIEYIAVIKLTYDHNVNGNRSYYYQLESVVYNLNKMVYMVVDFVDNNIIGYCSQNVYSGFVISRIFTGQTDNLNTPISYVDEYGRFKDIDMLLCTSEQIMDIYADYKESQSGESGYSTYSGSLYNESIFIPEDIYTGAYTNHKININEENYNKDALEVPVFEYASQADDTTEVLIGDDIFGHHVGNYIYFYSFVNGQNLTQENVINANHAEQISGGAEILNSAEINTTDEETMEIQLFESTEFTQSSFSFTNGSNISFTDNLDYAFFRHVYNINTGVEESVELLFIAKKVPNSNLSDSKTKLTLRINHYKLN